MPCVYVPLDEKVVIESLDIDISEDLMLFTGDIVMYALGFRE